MSATINTLAVVVRREDWNGNDARLTLFTKDRGKVEAVARGLRKAKSKLAAHLEPLTTTEVFLVDGRRFPILAGSSVVDRHLAIRQDLTRLTAGGLVLRILDLMVPLETRDDQVFSLVLETMKILNREQATGDQDLERFAHLFAWKLLVLSGYQPELRNCVVCRTPAAERVFFSARRGGVLHERCVQTTENARAIDLAAIKGLAYMVDAPMADALRLRSQNGALNDLSEVIRLIVEERFEVGANSEFWRSF